MCFVLSFETSPVYQININLSPLNWNEKICVGNKSKEIKSPNVSSVERAWFHVKSLSCLQSFVWWSGHCIFRKKIFGMSGETSWMRAIWLLGYQEGVEIYKGWTLKAIKVYFPFCWELFSSHMENMLRFLKCHFSVLTETKV